MKALFLAAVLFASSAALAADGISGSIVDIYDIEMKLDNIRVMRQGDGGHAIPLESLPLSANPNVWLSMVKEASFTPDGTSVNITASLQTENANEIEDVIKDSALYWFEGVTADGARQGNKVKFPLREVKTLKITTEFISPAVARAGGLPAENENVLWINSVPQGAEVFVKSGGPRGDRDFKSVGKTPIKIDVLPGRLTVRVAVPPAIAKTLKPLEKHEQANDVFEYDGAAGIGINNENVIDYFEYNVQKREGSAATKIALFQTKGLSLKDAVQSFPTGKNYNFNERKLEGALLNRGIPKGDVPTVLEGLRRAGKIVWNSQTESLIIELTPGERGWFIQDAGKPKGR